MVAVAGGLRGHPVCVCESAQILRQLLGIVKLRPSSASGWTPASVYAGLVPSSVAPDYVIRSTASSSNKQQTAGSRQKQEQE